MDIGFARVNRPRGSCCVSLSGIWCSLMCDAGTGEMRPHPGAGLVPHPGRYPLVVCDPNAPLSAVTCIFDFPSQSSGISLEKLTKVRRFSFFQNVSSMFSTRVSASSRNKSCALLTIMVKSYEQKPFLVSSR